MMALPHRVIFVAAICISASQAFVTVPNAPRLITSPQRNHHAALHAVLDPQSIHDVILQSSQLIADDSTAAAFKTTAELGWWGQYIDLFKGALALVHDTVEGPLRSVGIEQTWGISIAIFTAGIRSLLLPLSIQQSKSSEYMKALKPYVTDIQQKFKDNDEAKNRAIGKLYEDANQNPLAGCLVSLAQLPVFLGLYRGIRVLAREDQLNEPFLWIPSLEGPVRPPTYQGLDWITQGWAGNPDGGLPIPPLGWETTIAFLIMPLILVLLQSFTMQSLQPPVDENLPEEEKKQAESTQAVFRLLPLLIGFFSLQVPAGLTIYWFTSNLFTLSQSLGVRAYFAANPPKIELPEYWENALQGDVDKMTPEEKRQASQAGIRIGPTMEELVAEGKFHFRVERESPLRTAAPKETSSIPDEFVAWVGQQPSPTKTEAATAT